MHVGHLNTNPDWGGGEYQVLNLVTGLHARCIDTTLFSHPEGKLLASAVEHGLPVEALELADSVAQVSARVRDNGIDVLHSHDSGSTSLGIRISRQTGVPLVLSRRVASRLRRNPVSRWKYSARNIRAVIAISETVRNVFLQSGYPPDRVYVVPSGIDIAALDAVVGDPALRQKFPAAFLVVGIGKLSAKKNWGLTVRVAARLAAEGMDIAWLIAGEGSERARLEELAAELGVSDKVQFLGFRTDCQRLLRSADLLFFPSRMEGASVTVREAMVLETPVVAANADGIAESLDGNGWLVDPDDVEGAAACVKEALLDARKRSQKTSDARESALARFSIEKTIDGTVAVYDSILGGTSSR